MNTLLSSIPLHALAQTTAPKAVELVGGTPTVTTTNWAPILWLVIGLGVAIIIAAALAYRWSRTSPLDQAFGILAFRLRLRRAERRLLRDLAGAAGTPVSLLLSEHAFAHAVTQRERSGTGIDPALVQRLRRRAFG